ncbi:MAG: serine hydrolase domain-containing protein [Bacteroidota bacterium]
MMMGNFIKSFFVICLVLFSSGSFSQEKYNIDSIEKNIDQYMKYFSGNNPGAVVAVMKKGDILFNKSYGLSNVNQNKPLQNSEAFNLANLSKMFTAFAVFQLAEKNKLNPDQSLTDIFPGFPDYGSQVKIRHLMNHTSGLKEFDAKELSTNEDVFEFLKEQKETNFNSGEKWEYSNADYPLLVKIIEQVSGKSYSEYLSKRIFKKIKTDHTFFVEDKMAHSNIAAGHIKENDQYVVTDESNLIYGEQGIFMHAEDFAKWDKALYTNKLLDCEPLSEFFTRGKLNNGENIPSYYGYGLVLMEKNDERYWWHGGSSMDGYTNMYLHFPNHELTVLILSNRQDGYDFLKMAIYIAKLFEKDIKL